MILLMVLLDLMVKTFEFFTAEGAKDVGIEIYTLSKTYNMAGWRVGFAMGNESVISSY